MAMGPLEPFDDNLLTSATIPKPAELRRKTDSVFLYLFIGAFFLWLSVGIYLLSTGSPQQLEEEGKQFIEGLKKKRHTNDYRSYEDLQSLQEAVPKPTPPRNYVQEYYPGFLVAMVLTVVLILGEIYMLRWYAHFAVWASIYIEVTLFLLAGLGFIGLYLLHDPNPSYMVLAGIWLVCGIVSAALVCKFRERIRLTIELIKEASRAIADLPSTLFFPLIPLVLQVLLMTFSTSSFLMLLCRLDHSSQADLQDQVRYSYSLTLITTLLYGLSVLWLFYFVNGFVNMVLAGAFGTWYWTNPKSSIRRNPVWSSLKIATKFHLGTLALGSLVLALVQLLLMLIRAIFRRRLENSDCLPCCSYFQSLIRDMIKYLNKIVYIVTMMRGTGFVDSAKETFKIFSSAANVLQIVVIKQITYLVLGLAQLVIVFISCGIGYVILYSNKAADEAGPSVILLLFLGLACFYITSFCVNVFHTAIDTMFVCFVEDLVTNDGSAEKPFYMTMNLGVIFGRSAKDVEETA